MHYFYKEHFRLHEWRKNLKFSIENGHEWNTNKD